MKTRILFLLLAFTGYLFAQTASLEDVRKNSSTNEVTESFTIGSGTTLTVGSGGTLAMGVGATFNNPTFTGTAALPATWSVGGVTIVPSADELNFIDGLTSAVQTQLDGKQPLNAFLTELSLGTDVDLTSQVTGALPVANGGTGQVTLSASIQALLDDVETDQGALLYRNGTDWVALAPGASGHVLKTLGAGANPIWEEPNELEIEARLPKGWIEGLYMDSAAAPGSSQNLEISFGQARDDTDAENMVLSAAFEKDSQAIWDVGSTSGGLFSSTGAGTVSVSSGSAIVTGTGTSFTTFYKVGNVFYHADLGLSKVITAITNDLSLTCETNWLANDPTSSYFNGGPFAASLGAWYHVWLIKRSDTNVVDVVFYACGDYSHPVFTNSPPVAYDYFRRLGTVWISSGGLFPAFNRIKDTYYFDTLSETDNTVTTARTIVDISHLVPPGQRREVIVRGTVLNAAAGVLVWFGNIEEDDVAPALTIGTGNVLPAVRTQVAGGAFAFPPTRFVLSEDSTFGIRSTAAATTVRMSILGYTDDRGVE